MYKITLYSVGKSKEAWLQDALSIYQTRLKNKITFDFKWAKNSNQLVKWLEKEQKIICLDEGGKEYSSTQFSKFFFKQLEQFGCELHLVIGDAEGIPKELKKFMSLSLSKMTFTHQMARLVLIEQIYRAWTIKEGIPYHNP